VNVFLVDGTYELFRHHFALPSHTDGAGREIGAVRGVLTSMLALLREGATHLGVATDHVIESFRNDLFAGYKSSAGVESALLGQFRLLEEALAAMGLVVWPMVELEADDGLASAAAAVAADPSVDRVLICSPDKDLTQCVRGDRVVMLDRRKRQVTGEEGVRARYGVGPASIPDWLALVGDSADGYPGLPRWGSASATAVLRRWQHIENIPALAERWEVSVRGASALAASLRDGRHEVALYKTLATLRADAALVAGTEELRWNGPRDDFAGMCQRLDMADFGARVGDLARRHTP
jgi:5'-3' exonuclease